MGTRGVFVHVGNGRGSIGFSYTEDLSINQSINQSNILSICAQPPLNQNSRASFIVWVPLLPSRKWEEDSPYVIRVAPAGKGTQNPALFTLDYTGRFVSAVSQ